MYIPDEDGNVEKKSKEQIEAEKRAILAQRTPKLEIAGFDSGKLTEKAKELHNLIMRLESEKYDLEKRFKAQQYDVSENAVNSDTACRNVLPCIGYVSPLR